MSYQPYALKSVRYQITATPTAQVVISAVAGHRLRVFAIHFRTGSARTVTLRSGSTALFGAKYAAAGGVDLSVTPPGFIVATASGASLKVNVGATGTPLQINLSYYEHKGT